MENKDIVAGLNVESFADASETARALLTEVVDESWIEDDTAARTIKVMLDRLAVEILSIPDRPAQIGAYPVELRLARLEAERLQTAIAEFEWDLAQPYVTDARRAYLSSRGRRLQSSIRGFLIMLS